LSPAAGSLALSAPWHVNVGGIPWGKHNQKSGENHGKPMENPWKSMETHGKPQNMGSTEVLIFF